MAIKNEHQQVLLIASILSFFFLGGGGVMTKIVAGSFIFVFRYSIKGEVSLLFVFRLSFFAFCFSTFEFGPNIEL